MTGVLYDEAADDPLGPLVQALRDFEPAAYDSAAVRRHAEGFSHARFHERIRAAAEAVLPVIGVRGVPVEDGPPVPVWMLRASERWSHPARSRSTPRRLR